MELQIVNSEKNTNIIEQRYEKILLKQRNPFIVANTIEVDFKHLREDCTIPVFSKDNEVTISHQEFIHCIEECASKFFGKEEVSKPQIRVSHVIKGRIPDAIRKPAKDLLPNEKTIYYERMAFVIDIPSVQQEIGGNRLSLSIGGVRAYNQENLYSKKTIEKFKVFIGFKNWVCTNLCISTDGLLAEIRVSSITELQEKAYSLFQNYNVEKHWNSLRKLSEFSISENQFAHLIGKVKMYGYLPKSEKEELPVLTITEAQLNSIVKDYYEDTNFGKEEDGSISLWNFYNLFTGANKSSYIDTFLDRNENAFTFAEGLSKAINGNGNYRWFLS